MAPELDELRHYENLRANASGRLSLSDPRDATAVERWAGGVDALIESLVTRQREVQGNPDLSAQAKARLRDEAANAEAVLDRFSEALADNDRFAAEIATVEQRAPWLEPVRDSLGTVTGYVERQRPEHTAIAEQRHAEIRALLRTKTPLDVRGIYLARMNSHGVDDEVVQAIERAPGIAPLIDDDTRAKGLELAVENSPSAAAVRSMRNALAVRQAIAMKAEQVLRELGATKLQRRTLILGSETEAKARARR